MKSMPRNQLKKYYFKKLSSIPNLNKKTNKQKGGIICFDIHLHFDCGWPCNWWPTNLSWLMESMPNAKKQTKRYWPFSSGQYL